MDVHACQSFVQLLNSQDEWTTDDSMLAVIPAKAREFSSQPDWPKLKALAYLNNNVTALRAAFEAVEAGEALDLEQLNPVIETIRLRAVVVPSESRPGLVTAPLTLWPTLVTDRMNLGTAWIRWTVQRAFFDLINYAQHRRADPVYPAATPFRVRVERCGAATCGRLFAAVTGRPAPCPSCSHLRE